MVGCVGDDDFGRALRAALTAEGIDDRAVRTVPGAPTGIAMITVDEAGENIITVAPGANREVGAPEISVIRSRGRGKVGEGAAEGAAAILRRCGGARAGDQRRGPGARRSPAALERAPPAPRPLAVLNLAPAPPREEAAGILKARPDWLVVNESEAAAVLGQAGQWPGRRRQRGSRPRGGRRRNAVVTAGAAGAAYHAPGNGEGQAPRGTVAAFPVRAVDTVGAGDTFVGALAVALAAGIPPAEAVTAAAAAAAPPPRPGRARRPGCPVPPTSAPRPVTSGHSPSSTDQT